MSPATRKVLAYAKRHDLEIVSYGLAPNPWGFCFEKGENSSNHACRTFSGMLEGLSKGEEEELKREVFG